MTNFRFLSFRLLLMLGLTTVIFNSCGKDNDPEQEQEGTTVTVTGISLDMSTLTLDTGEDYTLKAIVKPDNATDGTVTWTSSDNAKATVSNGKVIAVAAGTTTITAQAGDKTATCIVTVKNNPLTYDEGVVINGVRWATRNVAVPGKFASKSEDVGMFYQWNRKEAWAATGDVTNWDTNMPEGDSWTKANDPSPAGWHVPTLGDIKKLLDTDKVNNEWKTQNGVDGRKFTDKSTGNSIFLPAAGYRSNSSGMLQYADLSGGYWSSTANEHLGSFACYLSFYDENADWGSISRRTGSTIRSVAD